ncbi:MAG: hypothetical protein ACLGGX_11815 [Bdellovibrionia bacterium]
MNDDLMIFQRYFSMPEAQVICSRLRAEGLHPEIKDENLHSIAPHLSIAMGSIIVLLPADEHQAANEIIASFSQNSNEPTNQEAHVETPAPYADSDKMVRKIHLNAIFGLFILPVVTTAYSLFLSLKLVLSGRKLSYYGKTRLALANIFNLVAIFILYYLFGSEFRNLLNFNFPLFNL